MLFFSLFMSELFVENAPHECSHLYICTAYVANEYAQFSCACALMFPFLGKHFIRFFWESILYFAESRFLLQYTVVKSGIGFQDSTSTFSECLDEQKKLVVSTSVRPSRNKLNHTRLGSRGLLYIYTLMRFLGV